jgi:hypothetical protein
MRTETSNRWLNVTLLLALVATLYLSYFYKDEDLQDYYQNRATHSEPADADGSISAR